MKKSICAVALLGTFAGVTSAQTNVSIYGIVDVSIQRFDTSTSSPVWQMEDANSGAFNKNGSRVGFKGSEDLGGGLSAIFTLENGFNIDNGTTGQGGRLFGRQAWVGLKGGLGTLTMGRQYTATFLTSDAVDPFGLGYAGNLSRVFNTNGFRADNTIAYFTPNLGGFFGQVNYALGEVAGNNSAGRNITSSLGYANGPVMVRFAYGDVKANPAVAGSLDNKTAMLGGTFDFGAAKLHAAFQADKLETPAGARSIEDKNWMLGVSAPIGYGRILASYVRRNADIITATRGDLDQYAIGYVHSLSKRTDVYSSYARQNDKSVTNVDNTVFQVGFQHRF